MTLRAKLARRVAIRQLDLDDIRAKIAKLKGPVKGQIVPPRRKRPLCVLIAQAAIQSFLGVPESARPDSDGAGPTTQELRAAILQPVDQPRGAGGPS